MRFSKVGRFFAIFAGVFLLAQITAAYAYQVAPMIYDLKPSGRGATAVLRVKNDSERPITIELVAEKRDFDETGKESRKPADDDFVLFPPQAVIAPNATQAVRVQYVGDANIKQSVMYTVTVKQVPVDLPTTGPSGVQFIFNFSTLANIVPEGAKADVQIVSMTLAGDNYALRLHNAGTKYANLALSRVTLTSGGQTQVIDGDPWRKALGVSWMLPGNDRVVLIPKASITLAGTPTAAFELVEAAR